MAKLLLTAPTAGQDGDTYAIRPLFVTVTPSLTLTGHDGQPSGKAALHAQPLSTTHSPLRFGAPALLSEGGRAFWRRAVFSQPAMLNTGLAYIPPGGM